MPNRCDVRDERSVSAFFAAVNERFGRVDVLVNNAGIGGPSRKVAQLSADDWREVIETNLTGMFLTTRAALPLMKRGASIVNNLSVSAKGVFPGMSAYNASKHGAAGFTNTLREELRQKGIRVIGLYPGATDTAIWEQFWPTGAAPAHDVAGDDRARGGVRPQPAAGSHGGRVGDRAHRRRALTNPITPVM